MSLERTVQGTSDQGVRRPRSFTTAVVYSRTSSARLAPSATIASLDEGVRGRAGVPRTEAVPVAVDQPGHRRAPRRVEGQGVAHRDRPRRHLADALALDEDRGVLGDGAARGSRNAASRIRIMLAVGYINSSTGQGKEA